MHCHQKVGVALYLSCSLISGPLWAASGADVARELTALNREKTGKCGASAPDFVCRGNLFRATIPSLDYNSWELSPKAKASGGFSFSYVQDEGMEFDRLVRNENNGFIVYPPAKTPSGKTSVKVLCAFPMDGGTDARSDKGCGTSNFASSQPCDKHKPLIDTGDEWMDHYKKDVAKSGDNRAECGFNVTDALNNYAVTNFQATTDAQLKLGNTSFDKQNELRLAAWDDSKPATLPIQAFFYLPDPPGGLADAMFDQQNYFEKTGIWVPVVKMTLPTSRKDYTHFDYSADDQAVSESGKVINRYVESAVWVERFDPGAGSNKWTLSVTLTEEGKKIKGSSGTDAVFAELVRREGRSPNWTPKPDLLDVRKDSMRRQLVCHYQIAPNKPQMNLEPFRPYVNDQASKEAGCNPV